MDVKKEAVGIMATILLIIPLAAGGYWVVKSFMDDPETSKANMLAVQNHSTQKYALMDKDDSDLESFFEKEEEEKPEKDPADEGTSEQDESQVDETKQMKAM